MEKEYYLLVFNENYADEHDVPAIACMSADEFTKWKLEVQEIHTYLGNSGDGFMEGNTEKPGQYYCDNGFVEITKVDKNFVESFNEANLSRLSLCSIFSAW